MLGYIATDAAIAPEALQALLISATNKSFNAITVDSDASTSDSVFLIATGAAANTRLRIRRSPAGRVPPRAGPCHAGSGDQIVRDGEGASKLITIDITGARDKISAHKIAMSVANSPLVKTAIAGGDANWGRIVMAVGKAVSPSTNLALRSPWEGSQSPAMARALRGLMKPRLKNIWRATTSPFRCALVTSRVPPASGRVISHMDISTSMPTTGLRWRCPWFM